MCLWGVDMLKDKLTKRQLKSIKLIGRWADGHCTTSKAKVTNNELYHLGLLTFKGDAVVLTEKGREIYKSL